MLSDKRPIILLVDDEENMSWIFQETLGHKYNILAAKTWERGSYLLSKKSPDLVILDLYIGESNGLKAMKEIHSQGYNPPILIITAHGSIETAVQAMKEGAYDYIVKPFNFETLENNIEQILKNRQQVKTERNIVFGSPQMQQSLTILDKAAVSNANIILLGESGTGKELFAQEAHRCSSRAEGPFVAINCAAVPENLLESELFGHEKGAFTGAYAQKIGKLQLANGGTIFLDEIGDMPMILQGKLLRVLEQRQIERLGGTKPVDLNIRVISATNKDLGRSMLEGQFRSDLYYRLAVIPINIPSLRERTGDILLLANHFLMHFTKKYDKRFRGVSKDAAQYLNLYRWPGNVRELQNLIEQVVILNDSFYLEPEHLPEYLFVDQPLNRWKDKKNHLVAEYARREICEALQRFNGNRTKAAEYLSMSVRNLQLKIKELGITPSDYKNSHLSNN